MKCCPAQVPWRGRAELGRVIKGQDHSGGLGTSVFSPCQACVFEEFCKLSSVSTEFCEKTRSAPGTSFDHFKVFGFFETEALGGFGALEGHDHRLCLTLLLDLDSPLKPNSSPIASFRRGLLQLPLSKLLSDRYLKWHQHPAPPSNLASFLFFLAPTTSPSRTVCLLSYLPSP